VLLLVTFVVGTVVPCWKCWYCTLLTFIDCLLLLMLLLRLFALAVCWLLLSRCWLLVIVGVAVVAVVCADLQLVVAVV